LHNQDFIRVLGINVPVFHAFYLIDKGRYGFYTAATVDIGFEFQRFHIAFFAKIKPQYLDGDDECHLED
jgi:hypothetical protein